MGWKEDLVNETVKDILKGMNQKCPKCGSANISTNLGSREEFDGGILKYECYACRHYFMVSR